MATTTRNKCRQIAEEAEKQRAEDAELKSKVWILNTAHEYCNIYGEKLTKFEEKLKDEPSPLKIFFGFVFLFLSFF